MRTSVFWSAFLLATSMVVCCVRPIGHPSRQGEVTILFSILQSTVSLHEPVYVLFSIHNGLNESIRSDLGIAGKQNFEFAIKEPRGAVVRTPSRPMEMEVMGRWIDRAPVAPGKTFTKDWS